MAELLKVPKTAERLDCSVGAVWKWIAEKRIRVVRLGRSVRVPLAEVQKIIEQGLPPAGGRNGRR
jgi:excisionase family DNA binding protein